MNQDEPTLIKMKYSSRQDHQRGLSAVISAGLISYHSIRHWKREPRYYTDGEVVLQSGDQTVKTNHSCTLKHSADSSHLIHKVTAVNTNVWVSCFAEQNVKTQILIPSSFAHFCELYSSALATACEAKGFIWVTHSTWHSRFCPMSMHRTPARLTWLIRTMATTFSLEQSNTKVGNPDRSPLSIRADGWLISHEVKIPYRRRSRALCGSGRGGFCA